MPTLRPGLQNIVVLESDCWISDHALSVDRHALALGIACKQHLHLQCEINDGVQNTDSSDQQQHPPQPGRHLVPSLVQTLQALNCLVDVGAHANRAYLRACTRMKSQTCHYPCIGCGPESLAFLAPELARLRHELVARARES